ncbi:hypothetical protein PT277_02840 [Acetobacteraceae bacterium ESL0709]|nr:hypothetical protein [Acetobacteraceae bacterium ESL0697]MDF7677640.1 hypothetical protein [Acetobacteraceae bacterium ESL0709]
MQDFLPYSVWRPVRKLCRIIAISTAIMGVSSLKAQASQWYTGSLVAPSATTDAGTWNIEPYYSYEQPMGYFNAHGGTGPIQRPVQRSFSNSTLWKYGLTPDVTVQIHTIVNYQWKHTEGHSHGPKMADLPFDAIYRFLDPDPKRYIPALSILAGIVFPVGDYNRLGHRQDGVGNGSYVFRLAFIEQSTYTLPGDHELRLRVWNWFRRALTSPKLKDTTSYGTFEGFRGRAQPGMSGQTGFAVEYGITQRWVLAMDLTHDWSNGARVRGYDLHGRYARKIGNASTDWQIAPAIEYNWNARWGVIVGSQFYFAGHNTGIEVFPQIAINAFF